MGKSYWKGRKANKECVNVQFATQFYWNTPTREEVAVFMH